MKRFEFTTLELESVFKDPNQQVAETLPDELTNQNRYLLVGVSQRNRIISVLFTLAGPQAATIRIANAWMTQGEPLKRYISSLPIEVSNNFAVLKQTPLSRLQIQRLERYPGAKKLNLGELIAGNRTKGALEK